MPKAICPVCKSTNSRVRMSRGVLSFTFVWDRECRECGTVWRPACPKWAGWIVLSVGFIIVALAMAAFVWLLRLSEGGILIIFLFWPTVLGISILVDGLRVVAGDLGRLRILHQGPGPDAFICPDCGETVSEQADSCPHCGHVWLGGKSRRKKGFNWMNIVGIVLLVILGLLLLGFMVMLIAHCR